MFRKAKPNIGPQGRVFFHTSQEGASGISSPCSTASRLRKWLVKSLPRVSGCGLLVALLITAATAAELSEDKTLHYLKNLSIDELLNTEVTSVSRKAEKLADAPAAVFVISQEDIRRSGVTSIPEALRMVPGLQVARINAKAWAITSRGFSDMFANKLLVLMDGRSVYTPLFSGVFWDVQDTLLEDVERIEVIRGPGATVWGANAVNGIITLSPNMLPTPRALSYPVAAEPKTSASAPYATEANWMITFTTASTPNTPITMTLPLLTAPKARTNGTSLARECALTGTKPNLTNSLYRATSSKPALENHPPFFP